MTNLERIRELNRTEDGRAIRRMVDCLSVRFGMTYADMLDFFMRCDPTIDRARFDELMRIGDDAP